jgi:hypothetical protein
VLRVILREKRYAELGYLLPMFYIEQAVKPGVPDLPLGSPAIWRLAHAAKATIGKNLTPTSGKAYCSGSAPNLNASQFAPPVVSAIIRMEDRTLYGGDRLLANAEILQITGKSYRLRGGGDSSKDSA